MGRNELYHRLNSNFTLQFLFTSSLQYLLISSLFLEVQLSSNSINYPLFITVTLLQVLFCCWGKTPLEDFNHVSISNFDKSLIIFWNIQRLWKFKSWNFLFSLFVVVLEFWTIEELFCANCKFKNKFCRNQLTCSNHVIWIIFISFICQIPLTLKTCDIIRSPFFFLRETPLESQSGYLN